MLWGRTLLLWGVPVGFGLLLSWAVTPELNWGVVSLSVGVALVSATTIAWIKAGWRLYAQLVVGIVLVLWGLKLLGWVTF